MQYFKDRNQAGLELAKLLARYRDSESVVMALSAGGAVVGEAIARELHLPLGLLASQEIRLPWDKAPVIGALDNTGKYTANEELGAGFIDEFEGEYHSYIEQEKMRASHEINMMHVSNIMKYESLRDKNIILVNDGLSEVLEIDEAMNYLKPVRIKRMIAALPVATIKVIDKLHISVDEIHCLDVKNNYIDTNHYYENNDLPSYEDLLTVLTDFDILS